MGNIELLIVQSEDKQGERGDMLKQINMLDNGKIKDFIEMKVGSLIKLLRNGIKAVDDV